MEKAGEKKNLQMKLPSADFLALFSQILKIAMRNQSYSPICLELDRYAKSLAGLRSEVISDLGRGVHIGLLRGKGILDQKNLFDFILSSGEEGSSA